MLWLDLIVEGGHKTWVSFFEMNCLIYRFKEIDSSISFSANKIFGFICHIVYFLKRHRIVFSLMFPGTLHKTLFIIHQEILTLCIKKENCKVAQESLYLFILTATSF